MDPKGDDSGSDTLDQSLQKKCVVADDDSSSSKKQPDAAVSEKNAADAPTTEPGGINMSDPKDSPASPSPPPPAAPPQQQPSPPTVIPSENNFLVDGGGGESATAIVAVVSGDDANDASLVVKDNKDLTETTTSSSNSSKDDSRGFESKVRQISDDLKDTTLADENSLEKAEGQQNDSSSVSASGTKEEKPPVAEEAAGSAASTCVDIKNDSDGYDSDRTITYESPSKKSSSSSSDKKKLKKITKKVRFKYNQHGKMCPDEGDDEDDDDEDTLNEGGRSKSILDPSQFPLSFESPHDEDDDILNEDASAQQLAGEAETAEDPPPEGGVQSILGKVSQMGKIEYLFRWVDKLGVHWENEEVLKEICPNLIKLYEEQRAKEREQDMHFAVRRKKTRQGLRNV
ncbi:clumping factor B [Eupeodes corollae]|uniref:clumping factor B n=1 Tax=Eupeodes corollae TaxID=290404 RepID=UPI0024931958|nr:clumping factor B [Eupeodes corollae]